MNSEEKILEMLIKLESKMDQRFEVMDQRFEKLETELDFVRSSVVRIEHEHGQKLDALFDGYHQLKNITERIEAHVAYQDDDILKRVFPSAMAK